MGVSQKDRSEKVLREVDELGKRPTSAGSVERNSRPLTYSFWGATPVCMNYAFMGSDRLKKRCTRNFGKLICALVGNENDPDLRDLVREHVAVVVVRRHAEAAIGPPGQG